MLNPASLYKVFTQEKTLPFSVIDSEVIVKQIQSVPVPIRSQINTQNYALSRPGMQVYTTSYVTNTTHQCYEKKKKNKNRISVILADSYPGVLSTLETHDNYPKSETPFENTFEVRLKEYFDAGVRHYLTPFTSQEIILKKLGIPLITSYEAANANIIRNFDVKFEYSRYKLLGYYFTMMRNLHNDKIYIEPPYKFLLVKLLCLIATSGLTIMTCFFVVLKYVKFKYDLDLKPEFNGIIADMMIYPSVYTLFVTIYIMVKRKDLSKNLAVDENEKFSWWQYMKRMFIKN